MKQKLTAILCTIAVAASLLVLPVQAAGRWSDLDESHWAYSAISRASELGMVRGNPDGTMAPDGTLTWGQYLTMLSLTFQGELYLNYPASAGAHWAYPYFAAVDAAGAIRTFMPVGADRLDTPITRQDASALTVLLLDCGTPTAAADPAVLDFLELPADYRPGVARAFALKLLSGYPDGTFGGSDTLTRAQGVVILLNALDVPIEEWNTVQPEPEPEPDPWWWWEDEDSDPLLRLGENNAKHLRLFGDENKRRFENREEAEANMVTVTVPAWKLKKDGTRTSGTATLKIHKALADEVVEIFTEIYNDPEQFPISSIGGYSWRGDNATGEHNCGTAIDINPTANFQVRDGQALAGTHWTPGEDPYSIAENGIVVRTFRAHGWDWGGDAWASDANPTYGYHDYMHFSYMGK